jgi:hypothetical protein
MSMIREQQLKHSRNRSHTLKNAAKAEQYLTEFEKVHGFAKAWELRQRLERGQISLGELPRP